ncbi:MAG TPA: pitrilysin family protein, partial [Myxococcales bacterium]|nr:pitrilysin family protein [Myxococcales bacterium]
GTFVRTQLPNGLTVLVEENPAAPVAALQVWVGVGSADERSDEEGLAHLHEHMLFKGTARRGPGEIARQIEAAGGEINAWTSFDQTVYHVVVASQFAGQGLEVLADAITEAAFDPAELSREIEVVCEEIKRSEDSPSRKVSKGLFAAAFARHPYGRPVIGTEESVRGFTRDGILRFYKRWYHPANCTLVAVGDLREAEVLRLAEAAFRFPGANGFAPATPRPQEPRHGAPAARVRKEPVKEAYLSLAWPAPSLRDSKVAALDALALVLGHGEASRLYRALKRDRLLVTDVSASAYTPVDPGLTLVGLTLKPEQLREAVREVLRQVYRLREEEVAPGELTLACRLLESDAVYQRETVQGMARKLGFWQSSAGGVEHEAAYYAQVAALSPAALLEAAEEHLDPRAVAASALLPPAAETDEAALTQLLSESVDEVLRRPRRSSPSRPAEARSPVRVLGRAKTGPLLREELPSGGVLLVKEERAVPLVALRAVWPGGLRAETEASSGLSYLLARLASKGTQKRGAEEVARAMEAMGGGLGGNAGRNSFGLRAELLSRHLAQGFELFGECIAQPAFAAAEVERERKLQIDELRSREDNPAGVAFQLFNETMYRRHPYRLDVLGTEASLSQMEPALLARERERLYPPGRAVISVVGDVDPDEVRGLVRARFGSQAALGPALAPPPEERPAGPRAALRKLEKAQAHLVLGYPGARLSDPERFPLEVLSAVLSGQGGRLFMELRDKKSLAYSITSFSMEGVDPGYFGVYIGCSPAKLSEALSGIRAELARVRESAPDADELTRARTHLIGTHAIGLQRNSARAAVCAFDECYGLGADASSRYAERVAAVTAADVLAAAQRFLDPRVEVIALVAPEGAAPREVAEAAQDTQ